jgi:PAS domain S-box-containing protein
MKGKSAVLIFNPATPSGEMVLNRFTLAFAGRHRHLEEHFARDYFERNLSHLRLCHWLTIFLYSIPGILDARFFPEMTASLWTIRFLVVCPIFLLGFGFTYTPYYRRWWQLISMGYILLTGGGFIAMIAIATPPVSYGYYVGIIISMMFGYALIRERFLYASVAGMTLLVAYLGVSLAVTPISADLLFHNGLYLFATNMLGMLIAYFLEFSARRDFFLGYMLNREQEKVTNLNTRLEEKVIRRTEALSTTNAALQRQIDEREKIETALRESRERLKVLFDFAPDGYCMLSLKGDIIEANQSVETITGCDREAFIGKKIFDLGLVASDPHFQARAIRKASLKGTPWGPGEFAIRRYNGRPATVEVRSHPVRIDDQICILVMIRDVTDRKTQAKVRRRLENKLAQAQKMEAVGTLAGGIAHDFNNILSAIIGYTELSRMDAPPDSALHENLGQIHTAGQRAKDLIQQILTFSRQHDTEIKPVRVRAIVEESLKLLRASIPQAIEIRQRIASEAFTLANETQLQQILMNLCTNAAYAMGSGGGILTVDLDDITVDTSSADPDINLPAGAYLRLTVSDTGCGMPPEVVRRLFDPYYTTKPKGEGSGLGMAVVHGIVSRYQGAIKVDSVEGQGTAVRVYLVPQAKAGGAPAEKLAPLPTGTETVLLVDDESQLVTIGEQMLTRLGYRVTVSADSVKALELFRVQPEAFAVVVTDMSMPKMSGVELARAILSIRPDMPIVLCTGYSAGIDRETVLSMGIRDLIMKPITMQALALSVRQAIDAGQMSAR